MSDLGRALNKDEKAILRETEILRQINKTLEYQIQLNNNKIQELEKEFAILVKSDKHINCGADMRGTI